MYFQYIFYSNNNKNTKIYHMLHLKCLVLKKAKIMLSDSENKTVSFTLVKYIWIHSNLQYLTAILPFSSSVNKTD